MLSCFLLLFYLFSRHGRCPHLLAVKLSTTDRRKPAKFKTEHQHQHHHHHHHHTNRKNQYLPPKKTKQNKTKGNPKRHDKTYIFLHSFLFFVCANSVLPSPPSAFKATVEKLNKAD